MTRSKSTYLAFLAVLLSPMAANADLIELEVVDATSIILTLSGTLIGPAPFTAAGILFIDTPVATSVGSPAISIIGDTMLGSLPIQSAFSGFNNPPYGGSLQLRGSSNGSVPLATGDLLSGTATITFNVAHGMTQSMFDGGGVPVYWGIANNSGFGSLQGYAHSPTQVPEPGTLALFGIGIAAIGFSRRRRRN